MHLACAASVIRMSASLREMWHASLPVCRSGRRPIGASQTDGRTFRNDTGLSYVSKRSWTQGRPIIAGETMCKLHDNLRRHVIAPINLKSIIGLKCIPNNLLKRREGCEYASVPQGSRVAHLA